MVTQRYYLEDRPVANPWSEARCSNREINYWPPCSSSEREFPALIRDDQVVPSDHLANQDSPPIKAGLTPLGRLTVEVAPYEGPPDSLAEALLKEKNLGLEDLERIVGGEVAAVHTHTRHLHPNEHRVGLQEVPDAQISASNKDAGLPWCILKRRRVFGPFVLLTNEQHIGTPLPGSLHQEVLGIPPPSEVELQELHFLPLNLRSSSRKTGQEPLPETWATSLSPLSRHVRHLGIASQLLATCPATPHLQQESFLSGFYNRQRVLKIVQYF